MLTVETADRVTILAPTIDRLDAANAAAFRLETDAHLAPGSRVLLDLEKIQFLDSTGLGVILGIFRQGRRRGTAPVPARAPRPDAVPHGPAGEQDPRPCRPHRGPGRLCRPSRRLTGARPGKPARCGCGRPPRHGWRGGNPPFRASPADPPRFFPGSRPR